jgi:hypothetical protein
MSCVSCVSYVLTQGESAKRQWEGRVPATSPAADRPSLNAAALRSG